MYKEIIIIIAVVALVVGFDFGTNQYTQKTVSSITQQLNELQDAIQENNQPLSEKKMQNINEEWKKRYDVLAFFLEHDELEKVETQLTQLTTNITLEDSSACIEEINTTIFILNHIQEKEEFHLRSIF